MPAALSMSINGLQKFPHCPDAPSSKRNPRPQAGVISPESYLFR
jgi:hypothetical protein